MDVRTGVWTRAADVGPPMRTKHTSYGTARGGTGCAITSPHGCWQRRRTRVSLPEHWPACLRWAGFLPSRLSEGLDKALVDTFLYHLYGTYLVVLAERMATCHNEHERPGSKVFPRAPQPGERSCYLWANRCGSVPRSLPVLALCMWLGIHPSGHDLVPWVGALALQPCSRLGPSWPRTMRPS